MRQQQFREDKKGTIRQNPDSYRQRFDKQDMTVKVGKPNKEAGDNAGGETYITTEIKIYYKQPGFHPTLGFRYSSIRKTSFAFV